MLLPTPPPLALAAPDDSKLLLPMLPLLLLVLLPVEEDEVDVVAMEQSFVVPMLRKVGVPSMVLTIGFSKPPRSNSCADIFLKIEQEEENENHFRMKTCNNGKGN